MMRPPETRIALTCADRRRIVHVLPTLDDRAHRALAATLDGTPMVCEETGERWVWLHRPLGWSLRAHRERG